MDSLEQKPVSSGSSTPGSAARTRAQLRRFRRDSTPPRSIKSEHFPAVGEQPRAKRGRPPIHHHNPDVVIKLEEEDSPSRNVLLVQTAASKRRREERRRDVKPGVKRSKSKQKAVKREESGSELEESDLVTDIDDVEARMEMVLEMDDDSGSDGYVDSDLDELEFEILKKKKGKGKGKAKEKNVDYSDLPGLTDVLEANLNLVLCGINPGILSATQGYPYAHPSNSFWKCLHQGGFTEKRLRPDQFAELPALCRIGLTNLSDRTTRTAVELTAPEMRERVLPLVTKLLDHRPKMICFVGMDITKVVLDHFKVLPILPTPENPKPAKIKPKAVVVKLGLQPVKLTFPPREDDDGGEGERGTCWFYCVPSTSGLGSKYQAKDKIILFQELKRQIDRMNTGEEMQNIPESMVEYRAEEFLARQALFEANQAAKKE